MGITSLLPSWTSLYKQVVRNGHSEDGPGDIRRVLSWGPELLFLTKRKKMCTQRHPLQFYL